jgi:hypothetical protein
MTTEIIVIIIMAFALVTTILGWANAAAHRDALSAICDDLSHDRAELTVELDRAKAAIKSTPVGPKFAWDPKDNCWVLKDCVRIDHGVTWFENPEFQAYVNSTLKYKKKKGGKPSDENQKAEEAKKRILKEIREINNL